MDHCHRAHSRGWSGKTQDPIQCLPSELAVIVIYEALRLDKVYSARLLELTTVSGTWKSFLFSMPVLWSRLNIDEKEPDLLATLAVFVHLSGSVPLTCVIWNLIIQDWPRIMSMLRPVYQRITVVIVRWATVEIWPGYDYDYRSLRFASTFFGHLEGLPNLTDVILDADTSFTLEEIELLNLPHEVKYTFTFGSGSLIKSETGNLRFFDMLAYDPVGIIPTILPLSVFLSLTAKPEQKFNHWTLLHSGSTLHHCKKTREFLTSLGTTEHLIRMTAHNLFHLVAVIPFSQIADLVDCLGELGSLQELYLDIRKDSIEDRQHIALPGTTFMGLRKLTVHLETSFHSNNSGHDPTVVQDAFNGLSLAFKSMYPGIRVFKWESWNSLDFWHALPSSYLQSLRGIESLELDQPFLNGDFPDYPIILWDLRDLSLSHLYMCHLVETPNLLRLRTSIHDGEALVNVDIQRLRKLIITGTDRSFDFNELYFPELRELDLTTYGTPVALIDSQLFPQLVSVNLTSSHFFTNPPGTLLCVELLYSPNQCPLLQQIRFNLCVEWDILFLMLERRNFGLSGVRKIDTVGLPFIPFDLRHSLALLLAGERAERPSLMRLSLEETREALFDATVQGCAFCLKNMVPGCGEAKISPERSDKPWDAADLYPEFDDPPDTLPTEARDWIDQRRELVDLWKASSDSFGLRFRRADICQRFPTKRSGMAGVTTLPEILT